jgi:hypothetical protein
LVAVSSNVKGSVSKGLFPNISSKSSLEKADSYFSTIGPAKPGYGGWIVLGGGIVAAVCTVG